jgi:prepilin-type processing-associated H-X9-DG protein
MCPDVQVPTYGYGWSPPTSNVTYYSSYVANWYCIQRWYSANVYCPVSQALISSPSTIIAFAEGPSLAYPNATYTYTAVAMNDNFAHVYLNVAAGCGITGGTSSQLYLGGCQRQNFPHSGGANYLFCDGHVKWMQQGVAGSNTASCGALWGRSASNLGGSKPDLYNQ